MVKRFAKKSPFFCRVVRVLSVVKEVGKSLVVFKLAFSEEDLHGILDGNCVIAVNVFLIF